MTGTITRTRVERGGRPRFRVQVTDDTGSIELIWFHGIGYFRKSLIKGKRLLFTGKVGKYGTCQMLHPQVEALGSEDKGPSVVFLPQYPVTTAMQSAHMGQKTLFGAISWVLRNVRRYPQLLPGAIEKKKGFAPLAECLKEIHIPTDPGNVDTYLARVRYEELYQLALALRWSRRKFALPGRPMVPGDLAHQIEEHLPFSLTCDQRKAVEVLHAEAASGKRMHRLLQGDVGSGKTVVAFLACLPALNEGLQVAWLAPTEVLALQTHALLSGWLANLGITPGLLKGGISAVQRRELVVGLRDGSCRFVVGTHALFQPSVSFGQLGMVVIDEQHKFGAEQRLALQQKDPASDFLLMSATPIPQTLAKTLYGDLDVVTIRSIPAGRQPVSTHLVPEEKRADMEEFVARELSKGKGQAYCVVPRIDASIPGDQKEIKDVQTVLARMQHGPLGEFAIGVLHGRMGNQEKEEVMQRFSAGELKLLIATTVLEVGVDVPAATVMIIENAEHFGLSQLHQLRGRVGRGAEKAYCFVLTDLGRQDDATARLERFRSTRDGFAIADLDLSLRGPGDVGGFRQSGWDDLRFADILRDANLFREIQEELDRLLVR